MYVRVPRTKQRKLQLPSEIRPDNAHIIQAGDVYHIRLELNELFHYTRSMSLKQGVVRKVFVERDRQRRTFE